MKILILFGHPAFQKSNVNKRLVEGLKDLDKVSFHDLYEAYPEMDIDIDREQQLLEEHDCIVFQHPMYWYSSPAIFKEWQDLVLEHGWAYGKEGKQLQDKYFLNVITTGSPKVAFQKNGFQEHTIREFLAPIHQMTKLCGMIFLPPFVIHGTHVLNREDIQNAQISYHSLLRDLTEEKIDLKKIVNLDYLNDYK